MEGTVQAGIIEQGLQLMIYGMGTVVVFLALLVVATWAMSRLMDRYFPEPVPEPAAAPVARSRSPATGDDAQVIAAISAALHRHRNKP
jgi:oxaloacetate decarboxylase gamma subunit